jgi:hypothetical protein
MHACLRDAIRHALQPVPVVQNPEQAATTQQPADKRHASDQSNLLSLLKTSVDL